VNQKQPGRPGARVLVATDFSEGAERALQTAIRFAKLLGAAIDLVHVYSIMPYVPDGGFPGTIPVPEPAPDLRPEVERQLTVLAARVREAGVECETAALVGDTVDEILTRASNDGAEIVVMGTHGRTGLKRVLLGSVSQKVLQRTNLPVLVVPVSERNR
jgi:nucleotide-binding universal stress UspA family protein